MIRLLPVFLLAVFSSPVSAQDIGAAETFHADIVETRQTACPGTEDLCTELTLSPIKGSYVGEEIHAMVDPQSFLGGAKRFSFKEGDRVIVDSQVVDGEPKFFVSDFVRTRSLWALATLFVVAVIVFGRKKAARSLIGMLLSFVILITLMLPAILNGSSPLVVSIVGGFVIMVVTLLLSHGWNAMTRSALLGILISLTVTAILSILYTEWAKLSGLADENMLLLFQENLNLDTKGLLLAGIIIGTLGVLDDITISQASAVFELRSANPKLSPQELFKRAMRIGGDHMAAAVNTLILAYAGASLPLLLLIISGPEQGGLLTILNREIFATEIVRTLVGSLGLLTAVPLTTWFASVTATGMKPEKLETIHRH